MTIGKSAQALISLAKSHGALGDAKEKCTLLEKALKMEEREYGADSLRCVRRSIIWTVVTQRICRGSKSGGHGTDPIHKRTSLR